MNEFEKQYFRDTEAITLADVTFHVYLPNENNSRYTRALTAEIIEYDEETNGYKRKEISPSEMVEAQIKQFIKTCIERVDGWDDYSTDKMLNLWEGCEALWKEAIEIANNKTEEAERTAKKPQTISPGQINGPSDTNSIRTSKKAAG